MSIWLDIGDVHLTQKRNNALSKRIDKQIGRNYKTKRIFLCAGITREAVSPTEAEFGIVPNEKEILYF